MGRVSAPGPARGRGARAVRGGGADPAAAVAPSQRHVVCVEADQVAARYAVLDAGRCGLADRVEVREGAMARALGRDELFPLVVADPPWVRRTETARFPEDPLTAIDGGDDGLDVARECVEVTGSHLAPGGAALLQLGSTDQVDALHAELGAAALRVAEVRDYQGGVVVLLRRAADVGDPGRPTLSTG